MDALVRPDDGDRGASASASDWKAIFALLDVALELDPEALPAWFAGLAPAEARHADALRALLAERTAIETGDFLRTPPRIDGAPAPARPGAMPGVVGPYRLLREIGEGGTATVWLAERADGLLDRKVALKLPHLQWGGPAFAERVSRERNILASLSHPNIARLYDAGVDDEGRPFLAIEYVDGEPIDAFAASHGLSTRARIGLLVQVARAVGHAHAQLVVHRDLKPSNILVDAQGRCHLLDFGIARLIDPTLETAGDLAPVTLVTGRALTPDYASPEQIRGDAIGTASDVYSLGVVAFELLAGERPYRLKSGLGAVSLANAIAAATVPRASSVAKAEALRRELAGDLDAIVARMLAKESEGRYATVDAVADDLERHLRGEPVQARPAARWYVIERWVRRHKVETGIGLALLLALAGGAYAQVLVAAALGAGALVALWQRNRALAAVKQAHEALQRGEQVKNFIASIFTQAVPRAGKGGPVAATDLLQAAARRVEADLVGQPAVAAELGALIGASFNELGDARAGLDWLPRAVELCTRELGPRHPLALQSRWRWVEAANAVGDLTVSERVLPSLLLDLRSAEPPAPDLLAAALESQAFVLTKHGQEAEAMAALEESVRIASRHFGEASPRTLACRGALSNTQIHFARFPQALQSIAPALAAATVAYGNQRPHPLLTMVERGHGDALAFNQRPRDATPILRQVLADQIALDVGETHRVRVAITLLARSCMQGGHLDEAVRLFLDAAEMHDRLALEGSHEGVSARAWIAAAWALHGNGEKALMHVAHAEALAVGQNQVTMYVVSRSTLRALALALSGRHAEAVEAAEALLITHPGLRGAPALRLRRAQAIAWRGTGEIERANAAIAAVLPLMDVSDSPIERGLVLAEAARCRLLAGDREGALAHWRSAIAVWDEGQVDGPELRRPLQGEFDSLLGAS